MQPQNPQPINVEPVNTPTGVSPQPPAPQPAQPTVAPANTWQFTGTAASQLNTAGPVSAEASAPSQFPAGDSIEWTASEYVAHDKAPSWFLAMAIIVVLLMASVYMLTYDIVSVVVIFVVALLFGYSASRRPQVRQFRIDAGGVSMGARFHPFSQLKSFTVSGEGAIKSIVLNPLKRYVPPAAMYYPPDHESRILEVLSHYLPFEPEKHDTVERVMRRIKF